MQSNLQWSSHAVNFSRWQLVYQSSKHYHSGNEKIANSRILRFIENTAAHTSLDNAEVSCGNLFWLTVWLSVIESLSLWKKQLNKNITWNTIIHGYLFTAISIGLKSGITQSSGNVRSRFSLVYAQRAVFLLAVKFPLQFRLLDFMSKTVELVSLANPGNLLMTSDA